MNRTANKNDSQGYLPSSAYLANPYVPFQTENPGKYEARRGLIRGTLYPGLDLPFMGMQNNRNLPITLMSELQALSFAVNELALYLDTHEDDHEAIELYRRYQELRAKCAEEYQNHFGPLTHGNSGRQNRYEWINGPWPWEYIKNKEA